MGYKLGAEGPSELGRLDVSKYGWAIVNIRLPGADCALLGPHLAAAGSLQRQRGAPQSSLSPNCVGRSSPPRRCRSELLKMASAQVGRLTGPLAAGMFRGSVGGGCEQRQPEMVQLGRQDGFWRFRPGRSGAYIRGGLASKRLQRTIGQACAASEGHSPLSASSRAAGGLRGQDQG